MTQEHKGRRVGSRRSRLLIQALISIMLLVGLTLWIDLEEAAQALRGASWPLLFGALLLTTFNRILMPLKWNLLLRATGSHCGWLSSIRIYYISSFLGLYLPPTVGQDAVRAYLVAREGNKFTSVISSILVERWLGLIALLFFSIGGGVLFLTHFRHVGTDPERIVVAMSGITALFLVGFVISFNKRVRNAAEWMLSKLGGLRFLEKPAENLSRLYRSYFAMRDRKVILAVFFLLSCFEVSLPIFRSYIVGVALGVKAPLLYYFAFIPIILVLIRLPISIDGFGLNEGGFVYFLSLVGVDKAVGFSVGLVNHLIFLVAILPGWYFYISTRKRNAIVPEAEASSLAGST